MPLQSRSENIATAGDGEKKRRRNVTRNTPICRIELHRPVVSVVTRFIPSHAILGRPNRADGRRTANEKKINENEIDGKCVRENV